ncbi:hypothetical protein DFH09DRAFT_1086657 [Mycena vulgaris]|nr:hypothetical protein DFH09DRAFT_1086657 [Mycena vulgaris]
MVVGSRIWTKLGISLVEVTASLLLQNLDKDALYAEGTLLVYFGPLGDSKFKQNFEKGKDQDPTSIGIIIGPTMGYEARAKAASTSSDDDSMWLHTKSGVKLIEPTSEKENTVTYNTGGVYILNVKYEGENPSQLTRSQRLHLSEPAGFRQVVTPMWDRGSASIHRRRPGTREIVENIRDITEMCRVSPNLFKPKDRGGITKLVWEMGLVWWDWE